MTKNRYMTPADIKREYTAMEFIDLVVDEHMTIKDAAEEVGIARSTWYYWVEQGKVDHLLRQKQEEVRSRFDFDPWGSQ
jgi:transposase-like protein